MPEGAAEEVFIRRTLDDANFDPGLPYDPVRDQMPAGESQLWPVEPPTAVVDRPVESDPEEPLGGRSSAPQSGRSRCAPQDGCRRIEAQEWIWEYAA